MTGMPKSDFSVKSARRHWLAVSDHALFSGCELAMICDFILADETAKFSQPEIRLGGIPDTGGSQHLTRLVGRAKLREMCLTGRLMNAAEAERAGLVLAIIPSGTLLEETLKTAAFIADMSLPVAMIDKEAVSPC